MWRYFYILEYGYSTLYYGNQVRKLITDKKQDNETGNEVGNDWILCDLELDSS